MERDDVEMFDPKAAVIEMLKKSENETLIVQEEATKVNQEKIRMQQELSLREKKKNREIWRMGMLDRVKKENALGRH